MDRTKKYGLVAIVCIIVGVVCLGLSWKLNNKNMANYNTSNVSYEEKTYTCSGNVKEIVIEDTSNDVTVERTSNVDKVTATYFVADGVLDYEVSESNGKFKLERKHINGSGIFGINFENPYVKVLVPEEFEGDVSVGCSSGRVEVSGIKGESVYGAASSGSVKLKNIEANTVSAMTSSGAIALESIKAEEVSANATSGSINLSNVEAGEYAGITTSGSNHLTDVTAKECSVTSTSGSIVFDKLQTEDLSCNATSGSVVGSIVGDEEDFAIATRTTSGSNNMRDKTSGKYSIDISTTSGSVKVSFQ